MVHIVLPSRAWALLGAGEQRICRAAADPGQCEWVEIFLLRGVGGIVTW